MRNKNEEQTRSLNGRRTRLTMIQSFKYMLADEPSANLDFRGFRQECRESLEKIIIGSEQGYDPRMAEA